MMLRSDFELLVYPDSPFEGRYTILPGVRLDAALDHVDEQHRRGIERKLWQGCRKLALMWYGGDQALAAEREFYSQTFQDSPTLFGEQAIYVHYHLEAFVLLARAALDVSSGVFSALLPVPFRRKRMDSFNDLVKAVRADLPGTPLASHFEMTCADPHSWVSLIATGEHGRSLRDKLAHQTEFPLDYDELYPNSEKEYPVVVLDNTTAVPLDVFVDRIRDGVIEGFLQLETACLKALASG
jgi:hypothetical protein